MTTSDLRPAKTPARPVVAWRGLSLISLAFGAALVAGSAGYGYHRDELYFLVIGAHPAFGYVDQPPLVPLLDHAVDTVSGHSLVCLRLPAALAGALTVLVTGLIAREFRAARGAQMLASASMAVASVLVSAAHLATTTVFDLLAWTVVSWLVVRAVRDDGRTWLLVGLVVGVGLEIKTLPIFLVFALFVGVLAVGPRQVLASRWLWAGSVIALTLWTPNLIWQATHDWPLLRLSAAIAAGDSGTSESRWAFLPFQLVLVSPLLVPVWIAGLWRLARDPGLARWRCFALAYPVLAVVFLIVGGKPYYLCGLYPVLLAAGAGPVLDWTRRGRARIGTLGVAMVLSAAVSAVLMLPTVPVAGLGDTPVVAINYDAGETVGWPRFVAQLGRVYDALPASQRAHTVVLAQNYGEAGAVARYRPDIPVYSGQNSLWDLGPPPANTTTAVVVGHPARDLHRWFAHATRVTRLDNGVDVDDDEQGTTVWVGSGPTATWIARWPQLRRLG